MNFHPVARAVATLAGGSRQDRAPGMSPAAMVDAHPIASTSRFWGRPAPIGRPEVVRKPRERTQVFAAWCGGVAPTPEELRS